MASLFSSLSKPLNLRQVSSLFGNDHRRVFGVQDRDEAALSKVFRQLAYEISFAVDHINDSVIGCHIQAQSNLHRNF